MIFDGKAFARQIEEQITNKVANLVKKPRIVSVIVGDDPASVLYTRLKKQAAERVGIEFEIVREKGEVKSEELIRQIEIIGAREDVTGVMVQLPLPKDFKGRTLKVLEMIPLDKDVDGLRWEKSGIMPATVSAVLSIVDTIAKDKNTFVILGARGAVGRPLVHFLRKRGAEVSEVEWDTPDPTRSVLVGQVVISCVGKAGIVTADMIGDSVIVIDVGMSEVEGKVVGDMTKEVYDKCSVAVPVPNGVGPVTIACLLANTVEIYGTRISKV